MGEWEYHSRTMDEELFKRFLKGDPAATTGIRNHLRAITARVLAAPQWGFRDHDRVRDLELTTVTEVMESPGESVLICATAAMLVSAREGLDELRSREALPQGHPDSTTLARELLEVLNRTESDALKAHLEECATCERHLQLGKQAIRQAISAQRTAPTTTQKIRRERPAPVASNARRARPVDQKRSNVKKKAKRKGENQGGALRALAPLLVTLAILGAMAWQRSLETPEEKVRRLANLLPAELPPTALADELDPGSRQAALDLSRGHCESGAGRLAIASDQAPDNRLLSYYAALGHTCARAPEQAMKYFDRLATIHGEAYFGERWWLANALVINDRLVEAKAHLEILIEEEHPRARNARTLLARIAEQK